MNDVLISIKPNYVEKILSGEKTVELRTKRANLEPGTRMWIYSTLPKGEVKAQVTVEHVHTDSPCTIWEKYGDQIAITKEEFTAYVQNRESVSAIKINSVSQLSNSPTLKMIKKELGSFTPPQFFMRLRNNQSLYRLLYQAT